MPEMTNPNPVAPKTDTPATPPEREGYWKWVIGGPYQGAVLRGGQIRHLHSSVVKEVFAEARGTKVADVLAGLMFAVDIVEERSRFAFEELNRVESTLAAERASLARAIQQRDQFLEERKAATQDYMAERASRLQADTALQAVSIIVAGEDELNRNDIEAIDDLIGKALSDRILTNELAIGIAKVVAALKPSVSPE